ncbi:MAG TPA: hypothetical protein VHS78_10025 [Candidatus Elarobacter sp.]|nr:hypothetical protein [Candidatus Elarobacter sp.]
MAAGTPDEPCCPESAPGEGDGLGRKDGVGVACGFGFGGLGFGGLGFRTGGVADRGKTDCRTGAGV